MADGSATVTLALPFTNALYAITALDVAGNVNTGGANLIAIRNSNSFNARCRLADADGYFTGWAWNGSPIKTMYLAAGW